MTANFPIYLLKTCMILLVFALSSGIIQAQQDELYVGMGDDLYEAGSKPAALGVYKLALFSNPNNVRANFMAGLGHYETINRGECLKYFKKAYELDPNISDSILFQIGEGYHLNNKFSEAIEYYDRFKKVLDDRLSSKVMSKIKYDRWVEKLEQKKSQCEVGIELIKTPLDVTLLPVKGVNTVFPDYSPAITQDELTMVFTSRRDGGMSPDVEIDLLKFEDIWITTRPNKDADWGEPTLVPGINTVRHESNIGISADGKELLVYKDDNAGDIFYSELNKKGEWSDLKPISNTVNSEFKESSASLSPDKKILFFSSNRPGGMGGFDIYMVEKLKGNKWGQAVNLGPPINTELDEDAPTIGFDGKTLYFASTGHPGMGEFDLFKAEFDSVTFTWGEPENLGYPINSSDDDRYYVQSLDGIHAYYSAVKDFGEGDMDIFKIVPKEEVEEEEEEVEEELPTEKVDSIPMDTTPVVAQVEKVEEEDEEEIVEMEVEEEEEEPVATPVLVSVEVTDREGNPLAPSKVMLSNIATSEKVKMNSIGAGKYEVTVLGEQAEKYRLQLEKAGYEFKNIDIMVPAATPEDQQVSKSVNMKKIVVKSRPTVLRNIYFDFDRATIRSVSYDELNLVVNMLKDNPNLKIQINGHTDSKGSDSYNKELSQRRANSVVRYLKEKGVDSARISAKGFGEERPLASNDDEIEGRELNRRTEFEVIGN